MVVFSCNYTSIFFIFFFTKKFYSNDFDHVKRYIQDKVDMLAPEKSIILNNFTTSVNFITPIIWLTCTKIINPSCRDVIKSLTQNKFENMEREGMIKEFFLAALDKSILCLRNTHVFVLTDVDCDQRENYSLISEMFHSQASIGQAIKYMRMWTNLIWITEGSIENCNISEFQKFNFTTAKIFRNYKAINIISNPYESSTHKSKPEVFDDSNDKHNNEKIVRVFIITVTYIMVAALLGFGGTFFVLKRRYYRKTIVNNMSLIHSKSIQKAHKASKNYNNHYSKSPSMPHSTLSNLPLENTDDNWEFNGSNVKITNILLGSGAFANVYKGKLLDDKESGGINRRVTYFFADHNSKDNEKHSLNVAVKVPRNAASEKNRQEFWSEVELMKKIGFHPHILNLIGYTRLDNVVNSEGMELDQESSSRSDSAAMLDAPCLILEYCSVGDLLRLLQANKRNLYEKMDIELDIDEQEPKLTTLLDLSHLVSFSWQISDAMIYLSSKNFVHRDIAARNVLVTGELVAKLADYGLCRHCEDNSYQSENGKLPVKWMAIESLSAFEFSTKSDVWSFAVLLYEIFSAGETPYKTIKAPDILQHLLAGNRLPQPDLCPTNIYELMQTCWYANPAKRPTFEMIRKHLSAELKLSDDIYGYVEFHGTTNCCILPNDPNSDIQQE